MERMSELDCFSDLKLPGLASGTVIAITNAKKIEGISIRRCGYVVARDDRKIEIGSFGQ
ncbi:hypothetical protein PC116_g34780 [Phytophthora cactorum]|nr:hypothetical protein PC116_g34780 [Phytophthora cactorum]